MTTITLNKTDFNLSISKLVNLTPHEINIHSADAGNEIKLQDTIKPSGNIARIEMNKKILGYLNGFAIWQTKAEKIINLPEPETGVGYIVSMVVREACPNRTDLFSPGDLIRNSAGQPVGCHGLVSN